MACVKGKRKFQNIMQHLKTTFQFTYFQENSFVLIFIKENFKKARSSLLQTFSLIPGHLTHTPTEVGKGLPITGERI